MNGPRFVLGRIRQNQIAEKSNDTSEISLAEIVAHYNITGHLFLVIQTANFVSRTAPEENSFSLCSNA